MLDSNVIVSGFNYPGNEGALLELARHGRFELVVSEFLLAEVQRVLLHRFDWSHARTALQLNSLRRLGLVVNPRPLVSSVPGNHPDNRILDCAVHTSADYLVTGDRRHLLPLKEFEGVTILRAPEFLEILDDETASLGQS
ncbi:MAG: putative toxin-antitoxin system toxin component, PIN family [Chloroflexota bacterium]|nr:putative toxin-antitoxin system toxin component, PIN family [Chloroflexota bacterium]